MQFADITVPDGAAASQTFTAMFKDGLLATWKNKAASNPSLRQTVTQGMRVAKGSVPRRVTLKVIVPFVYTVDSLDKVGETTAFIDFVVPEHAATADVENLLAYVEGVIGNAQISTCVKDGEFPA